jgi:hypothetical protein
MSPVLKPGFSLTQRLTDHVVDNYDIRSVLPFSYTNTYPELATSTDLSCASIRSASYNTDTLVRLVLV